MRWVLVLLLTGCSSVPLPSRCHEVGVAVDANDTVTGVILEEHIGTVTEVSVQCHSPFKLLAGCAIAVAPGYYILWYIDRPEERDHERCHALFEEKRHT